MISDVPGYPRAGHRAAVIGHPVDHSLSPVLHNAAYEALGLPGWTYEAIDVDETGLPGFLVDGRTGWAGWSLTMPLKRAVRPMLVRESRLARDVGAVNTVLVAPDGLEGFNTDVHGIVEAFGEAGVSRRQDGAPGPSATILGGGATAASAVAALAELGCSEPIVHVRSAARTVDLQAAAARLGVRPRLAPFEPASMISSVLRSDLVISTLPAGSADHLVADGVAAAAAERRPVLLDVVYEPWPTGLAEAWARTGATAIGGFVMLVHQAFGQVHLMTGERPPLAAMRAAGETELFRRHAAQPTLS
ncbi:MAG: shikimate dehydrogenase [Actinomycetota bacterium]|nr:shikimate dehydrogenase [Actinomycetota bacterium]